MGRDERCLQNFGGEISWETPIWKTDKEIGGWFLGKLVVCLGVDWTSLGSCPVVIEPLSSDTVMLIICENSAAKRKCTVIRGRIQKFLD
jgi:hypothetical protein